MSTDALSRVFAALGDPTRRDIVARLCRGDATASELAVPYQMSLQAVYKHLRVLEQAGLVSRPPGPQPRRVRLEVAALDLMDEWIERYRRRAEQRHQRLDRVLATMNDTDDSEEHLRDDDRGGSRGSRDPHDPRFPGHG